jgi:hypothetical protein
MATPVTPVMCSSGRTGTTAGGADALVGTDTGAGAAAGVVKIIVTAAIDGGAGSDGAARRNTSARAAKCASADATATARGDPSRRTGSQYRSAVRGDGSIVRCPDSGPRRNSIATPPA